VGHQKSYFDNPDKPKLSRSADLYDLTRSHVVVAPVNSMEMPFPYVNDFMMAMLNTELLLIGAKTGAGKTEFLTQMALAWAAKGYRVGFIALEAEPEEIEQRIMYKHYSRAYMKDEYRDRSLFLDYRRYRLGLLERQLSKYDTVVRESFIEQTKNLYTHYMSKASFTIIDLVDLMDDVKQNCDVCIIDHIHYFDMLGSKNDIEGMRSLMKRIREINLASKIPFVCAGHLRKDVQSIVPTIDDFMGSSDIGKIATSAILIAKKPDGYNAKMNTSTTLFSIPKLRGGGGTHFIGEIDFSLTHQEYIPRYSLSVPSFKGDKLHAVEKSEYPRWAKASDILEVEIGKTAYDF